MSSTGVTADGCMSNGTAEARPLEQMTKASIVLVTPIYPADPWMFGIQRTVMYPALWIVPTWRNFLPPRGQIRPGFICNVPRF